MLASRNIALAMVLAAACLGGCQSDGEPASGVAPTMSASTGRETATPIPKDSRFTIYAATFGGPLHAARAREARDTLIARDRKAPWYVVQEADQSKLYYGFYKVYNDEANPQESARVSKDLDRLRSMQNPNGSRPFGKALVVALQAPDPDAPPEWDLRNARGTWTLEIASYMDSPDRKQAAVESVRDAREAGVEAYYFHGPSISSVCIGSWPAQAVQMPPVRKANTLEATRDDGRPVVVSNAPLPQNLRLTNRDGQEAEVLRSQMRVVDPTLKAAMEAYPHHFLNGEPQAIQMKNPRTGERKALPRASMIVHIPTTDAVPGTSSAIGTPEASASDAPLLLDPGGSRTRSRLPSATEADRGF